MSSPTWRIDVAALTTGRDERWRIDVLDYATEQLLGTLDGVQPGGVLDFSIFDTIRSGGTLLVDPTRAQVDWPHIKLQPWYTPNVNVPDLWWPFGVFIPGTPKVSHFSSGEEATIDMYDKLLVLVRDKIESTWTYDAGVNPITAAAEVIASTGESKIVLEPTTETLASPLVWEAGTPKLRIVNDLLDAAGYFSISVDWWGYFRSEKYVAPRQRPVQWSFLDDPRTSIYSPFFEHEQDIFDIPNKVVLVGMSEDGETPPPSGTAVDEDPESDWSYQNRNNTWVTGTEFDIEATSETVLEEKAARRLLELQQVTSTFEIQHDKVPISLNGAVRFRRSGAYAVLALVQRMHGTMGLGALVRTTIREVQ